MLSGGGRVDQELLELERRYRVGGSAEDGAAWLQARVRAGVLDPRRLALAAHLGHPAARLVVDPPDLAFEPWLLALADWGKEAVVRALLSLVEVLSARGHRAVARRTREIVEPWVACPCAEHLERVRTQDRVADERLQETVVNGHVPPYGNELLFTQRTAPDAYAELPNEAAPDAEHVWDALLRITAADEHQALVLYRAAVPWTRHMHWEHHPERTGIVREIVSIATGKARRSFEAAVREVVGRELSAWALGAAA